MFYLMLREIIKHGIIYVDLAIKQQAEMGVEYVSIVVVVFGLGTIFIFEVSRREDTVVCRKTFHLIKTIFQASLELRQKSLFLHLFAYSNCHCLSALLLSRRSACLACFRAWWFSVDGSFHMFLESLVSCANTIH